MGNPSSPHCKEDIKLGTDHGLRKDREQPAARGVCNLNANIIAVNVYWEQPTAPQQIALLCRRIFSSCMYGMKCNLLPKRLVGHLTFWFGFACS